MAERDHKLTILLTEEEDTMLKRIAEEGGQTASNVVRQFIRRTHAQLFPSQPRVMKLRDGRRYRVAPGTKSGEPVVRVEGWWDAAREWEPMGLLRLDPSGKVATLEPVVPGMKPSLKDLADAWDKEER